LIQPVIEENGVLLVEEKSSSVEVDEQASQAS
jgi:hypothetical protein